MKDVTTTQNEYIVDVLSSLPGSVYWKDINGVYLGANDYAARKAGAASVEELIGKTDYDLFTKTHADQFRKHDLQVIQSGKELKWEEGSKSPEDGKPFVQLSSKKPLRDKKGNIVGIVGNTVDISELKKTQQELRVAKQKAEESSELKSQFIMNMQHDLRTPASGVATMLEILAKKETNLAKKETLEQVANSSKKLLNILNAIIEFDNIEKNSFPILSEKFNLHDITRDVEALELPTAILKHLNIKTHIDKEIPQELIGDSFRVQRILINLLSNAIKFTAKGNVEIDEVLWKYVDDKNVLVQIIVKDTGVGIPIDKQKIIFERFTKLDLSNKGLHSGLGLGLSMVKQFVDELNGSIEVKSTPGKGTNFICTLPFKLPEAESIAIKNDAAQSVLEGELTGAIEPTARILLVEDDEIAQLIGRSLLADEFHVQLDVATTGQESIDLINKAKPLYDLIFMDIGLPDGGGCEFAKKIHDISKETASIPIIALTAHDDDKTKKACNVCGMQDYLTKPLGILKMDRIFRKWLHKTIDHKEKEEKEIGEKDKIIDLNLGAKLICGDEDKAKETLKVLIDMLPNYKQQLDENFKNGGLEELKNIAHKLKGATAYCGTPRLKEAAKTLEEKIRLADKLAKEEVEPAYKNLLKEINNLEKAFEKIGLA